MIDLEKEKILAREWHDKCYGDIDFICNPDEYLINAWTERAELAQVEYSKLYNEKDHAELVADAAIEEINRLKQEEIKYKEKHGQLIGKIHALENKLARYKNPDYVLVPSEPTKEMIELGEDILSLDNDAENIYKAMIEAVEKDHDQQDS